MLGLVVVSHSQCLISSSASLGLATKTRGAFSSLYQLNRNVVDAGIKEGPVQSEVRNEIVLVGSDAVG